MAAGHGVVGLRTGQGHIAFRNLRVEGEPVALPTPFRVRVAPFWVVCGDAGAGAYEAFPDLCRTSTGELLCVFYAGYGHVGRVLVVYYTEGHGSDIRAIALRADPTGVTVLERQD